MTLKVTHLSTYDIYGGAARAAYRQHQALLEAGVDSQMLVRFKYSSDETVHAYYPSADLPHRIKRVISRYYLKTWRDGIKKRCVNSSISGALSDDRSEILLNFDSANLETDIINIHKVYDFIDLPNFFQTLPKQIPIVVTLHDLGFMTGGCDYPFRCHNFKQSCGQCPILLSSQPTDTSSSIYYDKVSAYKSRNNKTLAFVANSNWTLQQAKHSSLLASYTCKLINYGLNTKIFNPQRRHIARQALGLPITKPIVLFSAHNIDYARKGGKLLIEALENEAFSEDIIVITFGSGQLPIHRYPSFHFGQVNDERLQSLIYQAADVFVIPSLEEAFGQTALESVACGTVVAGFATGGIPDIVKKDVNGELVSVEDISALRQVIINLIKNVTLREQWTSKAENWINKRFSYKVTADHYIDLYHKLLN